MTNATQTRQEVSNGIDAEALKQTIARLRDERTGAAASCSSGRGFGVPLQLCSRP